MNDLYASTADQIAIRRHLVVSGDTTLTPPIDLAAESTALSPVGFAISNLAAGEEAEAFVGIRANDMSSFTEVYEDDAGAARVIPDSGLMASDRQAVSLRAMTRARSGSGVATRQITTATETR
jgi:hypothetical protein